MERIVEELIRQGKTIATMESCTGGGVANAITNIPGASEILRFSAVTYSNEYKVVMGINPKTIEDYTVYSPEVAREMAYHISDIAKSDYGVGITGKFSRQDINNPFGEDNRVFVCIYDKANDLYHEFDLYVDKEDRADNKADVIARIEEEMAKVLGLPTVTMRP